jgi:hypothetical protein
MAVSPYALVSLADLKSWLGIGALLDNTPLESAIDKATSIIENYCGRKLKSRTHYEWVMPRGERTVAIKNVPIQSVQTVAFGRQLAFTVTSDTSASDVLATVAFTGDELILTKVDSAGVKTTDTLTANTYRTTNALVAGVNATAVCWTASGSVNAYTRSLYRFGGRGVLDGPCHVQYPKDNISEYEIENDIGLIHITVDRFPSIRSDWSYSNRFPDGFYPLFVEYVGGYDSVPSDLEHVATELAADLYRARLDDDRMASESLGDYNYSRRSAEELLGERMNLLGQYKEVR